DVGAAGLNQAAEKAKALPAGLSCRPIPIEHGSFKGGKRIGIGDVLRLLLREMVKVGKFPPPAFPHCTGKLAMEIGEKEKRIGFTELLAHEDKRHLRIEQKNCRQQFHYIRFRERREPFSQAAVADLIVVLQESDKGRWRLPGAWLAARLAFPRAIGLALIAEAFRQRPCQMANGIIREGGIVAGAFACGDAVGGMMKIVVPFGGEKQRAVLLIARMKRNDVALILRHQV